MKKLVNDNPGTEPNPKSMGGYTVQDDMTGMGIDLGDNGVSPQPWSICNITLYRGEEMIKDVNGHYVCGISDSIHAYANAALIATAPELLSVLERALKDFTSGTWTEETYKLINETIAKAKALPTKQ